MLIYIAISGHGEWKTPKKKNGEIVANYRNCSYLCSGNTKQEFMQDHNKNIVEEPVAVSPMTTFSDVMSYLHSIRISTSDKARIGRRLVEETSGRFLTEAFERVDHLAQLRDDWDGNGALRISYKVLQNIREVLLRSSDMDWHHWMISPDVNGTLIMQSDRHVASLSIGEKEYSYLSRIDDHREGKSHIPFDADEFLMVMRRIG